VTAAGAGVSFPVLRGLVMLICVGGIAGMIIGTVATDNNNGVVITFGLVTAVSILALMAASSAMLHPVEAVTPFTAPAVDETLAAQVEDDVQALAARGTDEAALRHLVGEAVQLGRSAR
jgi:hypothetical protein